MNKWRRFLVFLKLYWLRLIGAVIGLIIVTAAGAFVVYCVQNFMALEPFSRKQISAQMGLFLPVLLLAQLLSIPFIFIMQYYLIHGGGLAKIGGTDVEKAKAAVRWDEVIGMEAAKREAWELVKLLKDRHLVKAIGGKTIKGTLMIGPPGCGKTYLAKAIATECGLPLLPAVGSEFVGIFVGQGAARIKSLFKKARAMARLEGGCIVFIDEIDSFARPRMADHGFGGAISHNATINQFLTELDGLRTVENNIVVLAATNVSEDELDPAIMRAGRFDRKIHFSLPNLDERRQLFDFYLLRVDADPHIDTALLARKCVGFSPADIDNMVREAGLIALRDRRERITMKDLSEAYDRVMFGLRANITLTEQEKVWTAYHEAGHAVVAYLTHPTNDVIKATIIPHRGSLGFVSQRPVEEMHSYNKEVLLANIKVSLASYVAERLKFGMTSSGVGGGLHSDFHTAMRIAHAMVWQYGMGDSGLIGDFHALVQAGGAAMISEKTKETLDADVQRLLQDCLKEVEQILTEKRDILEEFAQELLKKEELDYDEIEAIFQRHGLTAAARRFMKPADQRSS